MRKILIIEDDDACRHIVAVRLKHFGCELLEAITGQEGLELARRTRPDLVLLDLALPGLDGAGVLEGLRSDPALAGVPVIVVTAQNSRERVAEIVRHGVAGYIVKPFESATLDREVGKILAAPPTSAPETRPPVLVAAPGVEVREQARGALERVAAVTTVASGEEVLDAFDRVRPVVTVLDLEMPGMTGVETVKHLRWFRDGRCAFLALAANGAGRLDGVRRAGFAAVVEKPLRPSRLLTHVMAAADLEPEGLLRLLVEDHEGCPVVSVPDTRWPALARYAPALAGELCAAVEPGCDRLIVDLMEVTEANLCVAGLVADLIRTAPAANVRLAVCAPAAVTTVLGALTDTRRARYATSRDAALVALG